MTGVQFPMAAPWRIDFANCNQHTSDLQVNPNVSWTNSSLATNLMPYSGFFRPYQTTYLHEMGHQYGLRHVNNKCSVMGTDYTHINRSGNTATAYIGSDAAILLANVFGLKSQNDFSVSHWKYAGAGGGGNMYSIHTRNEIFRPAGQNYNLFIDTTSDPGETIYWGFSGGDAIQYELTLENSGYQNWTLRVGYYLSTDKTLSNNDISLGSHFVTVNRGDPLEFDVTISMPTNVPAGHYSVIARVDDDLFVNESIESNNTAYTRVYLSQ